MLWIRTITILGLASMVSAYPGRQQPLSPGSIKHATPRPLVVWHGLGDTSDSEGMATLKKDIEEMYPGIFVMSVKVPGEGSLDDERKAGFWGNATDQVDLVAEKIMSTPELAHGFDAIGFSQGGLFVRDYVQRYNTPPVHNLLTFGSPHMGIATLIPCKSNLDVTCRLAQAAAKRGIYGKWAQDNLIQAAYFRDQDRLQDFLTSNVYLTRLNGEVEDQPLARKNLASLEKFVMVMFDKDETVYPKESAIFGSLAPETHEMIRMEEHDFLYKEDHIGLKSLEDQGRTMVVQCAGSHMDLEWQDENGCAKQLVKMFVGQPQ